MNNTLEKLVLFNLKTFLGYTPALECRFRKDLGLSSAYLKKIILAACFSLDMQISDKDYHRLLFVSSHKTIKDFIKELEKRGINNNPSILLC